MCRNESGFLPVGKNDEGGSLNLLLFSNHDSHEASFGSSVGVNCCLWSSLSSSAISLANFFCSGVSSVNSEMSIFLSNQFNHSIYKQPYNII